MLPEHHEKTSDDLLCEQVSRVECSKPRSEPRASHGSGAK